MKLKLIAALTATVLAGPALAESHGGMDFTATGDASKGEDAFKKCQACHVVANDAGETLLGRKAKVGPNLYGVVGRVAGTVEGFKYSNLTVQAGEAGLRWNEADFVTYVGDPQGHLEAVITAAGGTPDGRSKMAKQRVKEDELRGLYALLLELQGGAPTEPAM